MNVLRLLLCLTTIVLPVVGAAQAAYHWGYDEDNGPNTWPDVCQTGTRQSPIDIRAADIDFVHLPKLHFTHYHHSGTVFVESNGVSLTVSGFDKWGDMQPYIYGGGLSHKYKLIQFHLHWSQESMAGSEHTLGTLHYPAEIHFVHMKEGNSMNESLFEEDGLAVVGAFLTLGYDSTPLTSLEGVLKTSIDKAQPSTPVHGYRPRVLLPSVTDSFYRYEGSLTTPGCQESVIWTLLSEPVSMTDAQFKLLRKLRVNDKFTDAAPHNVRPVQGMYGRRVAFRPSTFDRSLLCKSESPAFGLSLPLAVLVIPVLLAIAGTRLPLP